ncbi:MAG: DUF4328 domain-containing protein [Acidimicrobiia bacterium]
MSDDTTPMGDPAGESMGTPPPPPPAGSVPPPPPPPDATAGWAAPPPPPESLGAAPGAPGTPAPTPPGWAPPPPTVAVPSSYQWRDLRGLTNAITVILAIEIAAMVYAVVAFANRISVANDLLDGKFSFDMFKRADDADNMVKAALAIGALLSLTLLVLVIIWTFRAMKNNEALGRENARFTPGWGIAGWLIPLANLVIPVLILQDLWRGSDVSTARGSAYWRSNKGSALVGWYWAALILAGGRFRAGANDENLNSRHYLENLKQGDSIGLFGSVMAVAAAILGILMFRRIAARQDECLKAQQASWSSAPR